MINIAVIIHITYMLSIIIPTYNEEENIVKLLPYLKTNGGNNINEVIVVDGGSGDNTVTAAGNAGAITLICPDKGRAAQMNYGALHATGDILYFIHADTLPASSYVQDIQSAVADGFALGRYRTTFDSKNWILKLNAFFTRFDLFMCYGGDQTLFITKALFTAIGGFRNDMKIMEDYDIVERARKKAKYKVFTKSTLISARKYKTNSWLTVQKANYAIVKMYKSGACQDAMVEKYKALLNYQ
jgi:rSAM/selenodomain-associated transferase 2